MARTERPLRVEGSHSRQGTLDALMHEKKRSPNQFKFWLGSTIKSEQTRAASFDHLVGADSSI